MELKYKGYTIKIEQDQDAINPRENSNVGTMVCFHPRYNLGDEGHGYTKETLLAKLDDPDVVSLPLYLLDHSGLWVRTTRFECDPQGWDTTLVGYILASKSQALKDGIDPDRLKAILESEVEEYNNYLSGNVWGYIVTDRDGETVDSCWGFIGDVEKSGVVEAAEASVDLELRKNGEQMELFTEVTG